MHLAEWWSSIEGYVREKDWNGVLVCADAIQELGEERLAVTLRWICRKGLCFMYEHTPPSKWEARTPYRWIEPQNTLKQIVQGLTYDREEALEFWT